MTRHIGEEDLAKYREQDLGNRKTARIRSHLASCPHCRALDADLAAVTTLLAAAPAPAMPDQVTARIKAALMAEAAKPATAAAAARPVTQPPPGPGQRRQSRHAAGRRPGWHLPELRSQLAVRALGIATAAAAVVGGAYGLSQLGTAGQSAASSGTAGGSGSVAGPGLRVPAQFTGPVLHYPLAGRPTTVTPVSTGTDFVKQHLAAQVTGALRRGNRNLPAAGQAPGISNPGAHSAPSSIEHGRQLFHGIGISALQGCVSRISAGRRVLLVDVDRYQGKRATVIVVAAGGTGGSRVFVVGPGCSASRSDLITGTSLPKAG